MWHGINVEMAICCFVWTINISCDREVYHLLFFIIQHNGRLTICTNVQCTIMMIHDFSNKLGGSFVLLLNLLSLWILVMGFMWCFWFWSCDVSFIGRWMFLTMVLQYFLFFHCMRNIVIFLKSSINRHDKKAQGKWWRALWGLRACMWFL